MKVVRKHEAQWYEEAKEAFKATQGQHEKNVKEVRELNSENQKRHAEAVEHVEAVRERTKQVAAQAQAAQADGGEAEPPPELPVPPELPEPPVPVAEPEPPVFAVKKPTLFTAEQFLPDKNFDPAKDESFKMIGPLRVIHGDWVLTNEETGEVHTVPAAEMERLYVEQ
jgi:hypothetical protein